MGRISFIRVVAQSRIGTSRPPRVNVMPGLRPSFDDALLVGAISRDFVAAVGRTVAQQTVQQERIDEADFLRVDTDRQERIQVDATHFDVLDAR